MKRYYSNSPPYELFRDRSLRVFVKHRRYLRSRMKIKGKKNHFLKVLSVLERMLLDVLIVLTERWNRNRLIWKTRLCSLMKENTSLSTLPIYLPATYLLVNDERFGATRRIVVVKIQNAMKNLPRLCMHAWGWRLDTYVKLRLF